MARWVRYCFTRELYGLLFAQQRSPARDFRGGLVSSWFDEHRDPRDLRVLTTLEKGPKPWNIEPRQIEQENAIRKLTSELCTVPRLEVWGDDDGRGIELDARCPLPFRRFLVGRGDDETVRHDL